MADADVVASWSGGKDSCLALHLAVEAGARPLALMTMFDRGGRRSRSHALPPWLLRAQAAALGLPLLCGRADWDGYETRFSALLRQAHRRGATASVFGDIDLVPHREWEERVCAAAGLRARLPLWGWPRERVLQEIFRRGIRAVVVCVNERYLGREFCGRPYDRAFLADLPPGVDACGENGEFHTCVLDAPLFAAPLRVRLAATRLYVAPPEHGSARFWFARLQAAPGPRSE